MGLFIQMEWKQMLRSRWMQLVALLFVVIFAAISLIQQMALPVEGFTRQMASFLNLLLFLLPLFTLTIGSMSVASDIESGWYALLKTYPMSIFGYLWSKYVAIVASFLLILLLAFGIVLTISGITGQMQLPIVFIVLSFFMVVIFSALAVCCGVLAKNRLHALSLSLVFWALCLLLFSYVLMALGTVVSGTMLKYVTIVMIHLNPAEWLRFGYFMFSGQTTVLGPAYYGFTEFYSSFFGYFLFVLLSGLWVVLPLSIANWILSKKGRDV